MLIVHTVASRCGAGAARGSFDVWCRGRCRRVAYRLGHVVGGQGHTAQGGYYLEAVADGREDYYTKSGEVPGRWLGAGSVALGLDGEVRDDDFIAVLVGVSPLDGERLCRSNRRVSGLDLTLSAPKSVSVLWALGSASTTTAVAAAQDGGNSGDGGFLERTAVKARTGHNGVGQVDGEGLIAAAFVIAPAEPVTRSYTRT